jgi:probable rRNA maturation factor
MSSSARSVSPTTLAAAADPEPSPILAKLHQVLTVDVGIEDGDWSALGHVETWVEQAAAAVARERSQQLLNAPEVREPLIVAIALSTDAHVRRLNLAYRGLDKPTNVLSFPSGPSGTAVEGHLGDIILALETIVAEAKSLDVPLAHHLQHLTVHGLLHLLGFDHETDADAALMEPLETLILASLDIPDPYAGGELVNASAQ